MTEQKFWAIVKYRLKKNKQTQIEAAAVCGVSVRTFRNWIYKNLFPAIVDGYRLARFLGVSVEYLVTGKEKDTKTKIDSARSLLKEADNNLRKIRN